MKRIFVVFLMVAWLTGCSLPAAQPADPTAATQEELLPNSFTGLGGKMPEITVNTADGRCLKLSELLKEKELVVLNFWFQDCPWCIREFPVMEVAYQKYRDDVEILALNSVDGQQAVQAYWESRGMSISMAACPQSWARECGVTAYPTSIFIDREGVVCLIHTGAITTVEVWEQVFDAFVGENYRQTIYPSLQDVLG